MKIISPQDLKPRLTQGSEIAFLDVREHGQYGEGHPFFSVNLPFSILEARAPVLLPSKHAPIVVMDDGDGVSAKVLIALTNLGYTNISILEGGASGWIAAGYNVFKGVNVPSKTFGELVEHHAQTPSISADELNALLKSASPPLVFDGRSPKEYLKMSLPLALSCPNAELAYRAPLLMDDPNRTIVINCAGRTRSIIGAESLRQCGLPNKVYALRNGTSGWRLAGFDLQNGIEPQTLPELSAEQKEQNTEQAKRLINEWQLKPISLKTLEEWKADEERTLYILDVRTFEEYAAGHLPDSRHAPGGQLVQATDEQVAVRGAKIVLCDDTGLRSATTAFWLAGMGHDVSVLDLDVSELKSDLSELEKPVQEKHEPLQKQTDAISKRLITIEDAKERVLNGAVLVDASNGLDYRQAHIEGALWATRARVDTMNLSNDADIIVCGQRVEKLHGVVDELVRLKYQNVAYFIGSASLWREAGFTLVETPDSPSDEDCIDYLFFVHDRHDGNLQAAQEYLDWETGLLAQLDSQELSALNPPGPRV